MKIAYSVCFITLSDKELSDTQDHLPLGKLKNLFEKIKLPDPTFRAAKIFLLNDA
jgi:hypothetical protein